jgi:hypothetical protein
MKTNVSAQALNASSQEIAPDLPCDSKSVDQVVDGALRAAAGIIMSSSGSQNAMKISGFESKSIASPSIPSSANNSKSNIQEDFQDDITTDTDQHSHSTYTADYDFDNEGDDTYMNLSVGDILIITDTSDTDWWGGYKSSDPNKQIRWIPSSYISETVLRQKFKDFSI